MDKTTLEQELKELIISSLELEDITAGDIDSNEALFVEGLGLDSIDALELGLAIKKKYGITKENKKHFASVSALADFILASKAAA